MLIKKSDMPNLSKLTPKVVPCFIAGCLAGRDYNKDNIGKKVLPILARLIDKAIDEYNYAKKFVEAEEAENKMPHETIKERNQGQFLYTCPIINHLENCITTLARIYKVKATYFGHTKKQDLLNMRNSIEHIDDRIRDTIEESPVLNISEDSLIIEIAAKDNGKIQIKTSSIAEEIINLYHEIKKLL